MTAPPSSGSLLRWISHQRAMSCRTRLRVDCDLGTLPVNVRTSRAPSFSMIRQCRKAKSKGSSFFSEKSTLNTGLGLVIVILPPHASGPGVSLSLALAFHPLRTPFLGRRAPAQLLYLSFFRPCALIRERVLTNRPLGSVMALVLPPRTKSSQGFSTGMVRQINFLSMSSGEPYHAVALRGDS